MDITHSKAVSGVAEQALWDAHRDRVYRYLRRLTGEAHAAEDLTQETFLQAFRDLRRLPPPPDEVAWLMRVATNRAMDLFRRRRLIRWLPFRSEVHAGTVGDTADAVADRDLVERALRQVPPESAAVLVLRDAEGFTAPEIAAMLGLERAAVRKRLSRAREAFRDAYLRLKGDS